MPAYLQLDSLKRSFDKDNGSYRDNNGRVHDSTTRDHEDNRSFTKITAVLPLREHDSESFHPL